MSNVEDSYTGKLQYYPTLDRIDLKYNQNTFTISFNVLDYSYNNQVEFSYMLGLEKAWYQREKHQTGNFSQPASGQIHFPPQVEIQNPGMV